MRRERRNLALRRASWNSGVDVLGTVRVIRKLPPTVHDYRMSEAIENVSDLISGEGAGTQFFARTYVAQGMDTLFREGLLQLARRSDQARRSG
jgi:hypothetical protein